MTENFYINSFKNKVLKKSEKIPLNKYKKYRIYLEVIEKDIEEINELLEKVWGCKVELLCSLSSYGMITQVITITEEYLNINNIIKLRENFGYKYIFIDIIAKVKGNSTKFFDKIRPSNWFLKEY